MHILLQCVPCKYFYQMSRNTDRINHKITNKESYALLQKPTNATFIPQETMENDEEKTSVRQKSEVIYVKSKLVKNQETKGQEEKKSTSQGMESKTFGNAEIQIQ